MASVSSVYAKAIYEMAAEKGQVDGVLADLRSFSETLDSHIGLKSILFQSGIDPKAKRAMIEDLAKQMQLQELTSRALVMLAGRGRMEAVPEILASFIELKERSQGIRAGVLRTAVEMSSDDQAKLGAAISKKMGVKVQMTAVVDSSLLGGFVAEVGGKKFDASLKSQLENFKNQSI